MKDKFSSIFFFVLLGIVTFLFLYVLSPFFFPIFWAGLIAGLFRPFYKRLNKRKALPNLNAFITILVILIILILPLTLVGTMLVEESVRIYGSIAAGGFTENIQKSLDTLQQSRFIRYSHLDDQFIANKFSELAAGASKFIFESLTKLTQNMIIFVLMFAVMLYTLFYLIRDGDKLLNACFLFSPFSKARSRRLFDQVMTTTKAALKSTLVLGGIQGMIGGFLFWLTGIQAALMWGVVMVVAAILPVGSAIIWAPAGIIMLLLGHLWQGATILIAGTFVVGLIDNLLRPVLVGRDTRLHPLLIFLSTLGGLVIFGFSGFIIGPVTASLVLALWDIFEEHRADFASDKENPEQEIH